MKVCLSAYLSFKKQKTYIGSIFSDYVNIIFGVTKCSMAVPLFSMLYLRYVFFQNNTSEVSSYAYDNTSLTAGQNQGKLVNSLLIVLNSMFEWYQKTT